MSGFLDAASLLWKLSRDSCFCTVDVAVRLICSDYCDFRDEVEEELKSTEILIASDESILISS